MNSPLGCVCLALVLAPLAAMAQGSDLWAAKAKPEKLEEGPLKLEGLGPRQIIGAKVFQIPMQVNVARGNGGIWAVLDDQHLGVGVAIKQVMPDGPAAKAGLKPGQIITEVDGTSLVGLTVAECRGLVTGAPGTAVRIVVMDPKDFEKHAVVHLMRKIINNAPVAVAVPGIAPVPKIGGGAIAVGQITERPLMWDPKRHGEETVAQFSSADDGASDAIRRAFIEAEIRCSISDGDTPTVRVPPDSAMRAKEILQDLRTKGHWSLLTLSTKEGTLTPDLP